MTDSAVAEPQRYRGRHLLPAGGAIVRRFDPRFSLLAAAAAVILGLAMARATLLAAAAIAMALLVVLAFLAPVANLVLIVATTAIVPYSVQNRLAGGSAGLVLSDAFLLAGLVRALPLVVARLDRRRRPVALVITALVAIAAVQFLRGVLIGNDASTAGSELRTTLGLGTFFVALPVLADERGRRRLLGGLVITGVALGFWGLAQWVFDIGFDGGGLGVREGVAFTSAGRGQLQGGLYAFPVAVVLAFAALVAAPVKRRAVRLALVAVILLNATCMLLAYERTFWVAAAIALGFVLFRSGTEAWAKALLWGPVALLVLATGLATLLPGTLTTARERLMSLGQYGNDSSLRYRIVESRHVVEEITEHPLIGAGLGAKLWWSQPWYQVPMRPYHYTHNGYLWVAWKLGVPAVLMLTALLAAAVVTRGPPREDRGFEAVRRGAQAAVLLLLLVNVNFPSFNTYGITATMGVLLAIAWSPSALRRESAEETRESSPRWSRELGSTSPRFAATPSGAAG